jgi:hypothetical protein
VAGAFVNAAHAARAERLEDFELRKDRRRSSSSGAEDSGGGGSSDFATALIRQSGQSPRGEPSRIGLPHFAQVFGAVVFMVSAAS